jgi:hypothetical protein
MTFKQIAMWQFQEIVSDFFKEDMMVYFGYAFVSK